MQQNSDRSQSEPEKRLERRIIVGFNCLLVGVLALVIAAFVFIPELVSGAHALALGGFLVLAALAGLQIAARWIKQEIGILIRLDQPGPKQLWLRRTAATKARAKVVLMWIIAGSATWSLGAWASAVIDDMLPRYNMVNGRRMPPEEWIMWSTYGVILIAVLVAMRSAGAKFFVDESEPPK